MREFRWYLPRAAATFGLVAVAVIACTDHGDPVAPTRGGPGPATPGAPSPIELGRISCVASVAAKTVECGSPNASTGSAGADIVYGGQNKYVALTSANVEYDATTHKYTFDVRVRNLIPQAIGTIDGTSPDGSGVKLFFSQVPTATAGTGTITIDNADGTGTFTGASQPYYAYVSLLDQYQQSSVKTWQFDVPPTVTAIAFTLYVSSPVQFPHGWIEVSHPVYSLRRTYSKLMTGTVYDQYGHELPGAAITWSSGNLLLASVPVDSGLVTGLFPGAVQIIATSINSVEGAPAATQTGASQLTVTGTSLAWTAGAATTDWNTPANWDRGVAPSAQDSVTIPVLGSAIYPVFTQDQGITDVTVADGAQISLGAFNLTASGNVVSAPGTGGILATSGRTVMTGPGKVVTGRLPFMQVSGTYSLTGNVTGISRLRVDAGRVRNSAFRVRISGL
jgi:hypothetical protein